MREEDLTHIKKLYISGLSVMDISRQLGCSPHKITYWLDKEGFARRSLSQAMYSKYNPLGDPFTIKVILNEEEAALLWLGLGIYWGEGNKASKHCVRVTNTDAQLILRFAKFLTVICGVQKSKIKYNLICFNDSQIDIVKGYWSRVLKISGEKFGKIVQIPPQGKGTYQRKSLYGVCTVSVYNIKLKQWLLQKLDEIALPS